MYSDFDTEVIGFKSEPEIKRILINKSCQTDDLKTSSQKTQTTCTASCTSQTVPENILNFGGDHTYDPGKLLKFLNRVLPHLKEELKNCDSSHESNFILHEFGNLNIEGEGKFEQQCRQIILKPDFCKDKVVSCLSWNSSNVMLAVAYFEKSHNGWCYHESFIGLYNTEKPEFEKNIPTQLLKVPGCVRCIEFHNYIPSLLAAALYSGDVVMWDLKHEEILMSNKRGSGDEAPHVDVITFLTWRENKNGLWLVSAGRDGRIILWKVIVTNLTYEVHQRFLILKQHLLTTAAPSEHLEIIHMDFQSSGDPYCVVACDGGTVFYCSLAAGRSLASFPQYKDPVLHSFKQRKGIVTHISCSTDLFASSGTDSEIHIFKYQKETPVLKIHTKCAVLGVKWNSLNELVSWNDSVVECYKIHDFSTKNLIGEFEGSISTVGFRIPSFFCIVYLAELNVAASRFAHPVKSRKPKARDEMLIGSATRYIGGRKAVQTVYWRAKSKNSEKLVKTGRHFNLQKPTLDESQGMKTRFTSRMTDNKVCQQL